MEPAPLEIIVYYSQIDSVGLDLYINGGSKRYFTIQGIGARFVDNQHQFKMFDRVKITITKVEDDDRSRT